MRQRLGLPCVCLGLLGLLFTTGVTSTASAGNISVDLYNNDGNVADVSAALDFSVVSVDADTVKFNFAWDATQLTTAQISGGIRIDHIGIVDGIFVTPPTDDSNLDQSTGTLNFDQRTPPTGGGQLFQHELMKNAVFQLQEKSAQGNSNAALDPGDILMVTLDLKPTYTFQTVLDYLSNGTIRVGAHVISNAGQSQVYIGGPPPGTPPPSPTAAPEPSTFVLLGIGGIALLGYGKRRKRQQVA